jgi:hypothetical protein
VALRHRTLAPAVLTAVVAGLVGLHPSAASAVAPDDSQVFINEIHYDNSGVDAGEAIEIAGPEGTDLSGWSLVLYNGNGGASYGTQALGGVITEQQGGFGTLTYATAGLQNGGSDPDGVALVDAAGAVVQFLSYEGSLTATNGPAVGLTSTDVGVAQSARPSAPRSACGGREPPTATSPGTRSTSRSVR